MNALYKIKGTVIEGSKRGRKMGYPTLNMHADSSIPEGIYVSQTVIDDITFNSITFVGRAITFGETVFKAETYILNFDRDAYGKNVDVFILKLLRYNKKFDSEKDLVEQMEEDKRLTEEFFNRDITKQ